MFAVTFSVLNNIGYVMGESTAGRQKQDSVELYKKSLATLKDFADDIVLMLQNHRQVQETIDIVREKSRKYGLKINRGK